MGVKLNTVEPSHAKTLLLFTLLVWLTTTMSSAESSSKAVIRRLDAGSTLNAAKESALIKQVLRSNVEKATRGKANAPEERVPFFLPESENFASVLQFTKLNLIDKVRVNTWRIMQYSAENLFASLNLREEGTRLFESKDFAKLVAYVASSEPKSLKDEIFSILHKQYPNDDVLARVLVAGTKAKNMKSFAGDLLDLQLLRWQEAKTRQDEQTIFMLWELNLIGTELFESMAFSKWVELVKSRNENNWKKEVYSIMAEYYPDDAELARILVAGTKVDKQKSVAGDLLDLQLKRWLDPATKKSPEEIFVLWELHKIGTPLFESIAFSKWIKSITPANEQLPSVEHVYLLLNEHYPEDAQLASILVAGTKVQDERMKLFAGSVLDYQLQTWEDRAIHKSPQEIFHLWELDKVNTQLFESIAFLKWDKFFKSRNKNSEDYRTEMFSILAYYYPKDAELSRILVAGTKVDEQKALATSLLDMRNSKRKLKPDITLEKVFVQWKLHQIGTQLFESESFDTWITFVMSKHERDWENEVLSILTKYYPNDAELNRILDAGTKIEKWKDSATKLQDRQFNSWQIHDKDKTPEEIFERLGFHLMDTQLFESRAFAVLVASMSTNVESPAKIMFSILVKYYPDDAKLANILIAGTKVHDERMKLFAGDLLGLQLKRWQQPATKKSPEEIFVLWELHKIGTPLFESIAFSKWIKSITPANEQLPDVEHVYLLLNEHYPDDAELSRILVAGTKVDKQKALATALLSAQHKQNESFEKDFQLWELHKKDTSLFGSKDFAKWVGLFQSSDKDYSKYVMFSILVKYYPDDAMLANILIAGTKVQDERMKLFAEDLLDVQLKRWRDLETSQTPERIFELWKLHLISSSFFENVAFSKWITFFKSGIKELPDMFLVYFALKVHLKEDGLTRIVEEGKKIPNMKSVADELKEFMDKMKKATEKLKEFGLEKIKIVDTLFKNQLFEKYESYMRSAFGSKSDMVIIKMLEDNLGDTIVAKQIAAGDELMAEWRTKQFKLWLIEGKQPDDVKSKSKTNAADELLKQVWRTYEIFHGKRKVT